MTKEERMKLAAELGELTLKITIKSREVNVLQQRANEIANRLVNAPVEIKKSESDEK